MNVSAMILKKLSCENAKWAFEKRIFRFSSSIKAKSENKHFPVIYVSGIQPTGVPHLGNYFGFIQHWINLQNVCFLIYFTSFFSTYTPPVYL